MHIVRSYLKNLKLFFHIVTEISSFFHIIVFSLIVSYLRDETVSNDNWEGHHRDVEHGRERGYQTVEWEEREWRTRTATLWEGRDSLPRSEIHDDEWNSRYDNTINDWKSNDTRKWDNQNVHVRSHYRNERSKDLEHGESTQHK